MVNGRHFEIMGWLCTLFSFCHFAQIRGRCPGAVQPYRVPNVLAEIIISANVDLFGPVLQNINPLRTPALRQPVISPAPPLMHLHSLVHELIR
jgi:hypothetical protein